MTSLRGVSRNESADGARSVGIIALALIAVGCGGESVARYDGEGGNAGEVAEPPTDGSAESGGAAGTAGSSSVETGGVATGGTGGNATGGTGGVSGAETGHAVEGDPFPRVEFEDGNGYVDTCQQFPAGHGFSCWYFDGADSNYCGDPAPCNACLCGIPCDRQSGGVAECPAGLTGSATPRCVHETPNTIGFCMLACGESTTCPDGMKCAPYPELPIAVCVWLGSG